MTLEFLLYNHVMTIRDSQMLYDSANPDHFSFQKKNTRWDHIAVLADSNNSVHGDQFSKIGTIPMWEDRSSASPM